MTKIILDDKQILEELAKYYPLIIRTQYHIQIETVHGYHDIWLFGKRGPSYKLYGERYATTLCDVNTLLRKLKNYNYNITDKRNLEVLNDLLSKVRNKDGIFADAGFKNNKAKIVVLHKLNEDMELRIRTITNIKNSYEAEDFAIKMAIEMFPGDEPIYNDCESAVQKNQPRAQWIPRNKNRQADKFSNLRTSR